MARTNPCERLKNRWLINSMVRTNYGHRCTELRSSKSRYPSRCPRTGRFPFTIEGQDLQLFLSTACARVRSAMCDSKGSNGKTFLCIGRVRRLLINLAFTDQYILAIIHPCLSRQSNSPSTLPGLTKRSLLVSDNAHSFQHEG